MRRKADQEWEMAAARADRDPLDEVKHIKAAKELEQELRELG